MSLLPIQIPSMGESISQAIVAKLLVPSGEWVERDQELLELETDKVNQILFSPSSGRVTWRVEEGERVIIGQIVGELDETALAASLSTPDPSISEKAESMSEEARRVEAKPTSRKKQIGTSASQPVGQEVAQQVEQQTAASSELRKRGKKSQDPMKSSKASVGALNQEVPVFSIAQGSSCELLALAPFKIDSSSMGQARQTQAHYLAQLDQQPLEQLLDKEAAKAPPETAGFNSPPERATHLPHAPMPSCKRGEGVKEVRTRLSQMRRTIADRLLQASSQTAMLTTFNEIDMTQLMQYRESYQAEFIKKHGVKLGYNSFFAKAIVSALKSVPSLHARIEGNEWVQALDYHLAVAVSTERGLLVPVIRHCDELSLADIERELVDLANRAREGKIGLHELTGGSFTLTNGGVFGSLLSTPIINPPQSAILGLHKIQKRAVVTSDDQIVARSMMYVALSYDHRVIDGKEAVTFLVHVKDAIENPERLWLDL